VDPQTYTFSCLADAIDHLASRDEMSKTKVQEPNLFDSSDPCKLYAFLVQRKLNFQAHPKEFRTDRAKVMFMQSYLKGTALEWFEPDLLADDDDKPPAWLDNYSDFLTELIKNIGPHDPVGDAEAQLEQLHMRRSAYHQVHCRI